MEVPLEVSPDGRLHLGYLGERFGQTGDDHGKLELGDVDQALLVLLHVDSRLKGLRPNPRTCDIK